MEILDLYDYKRNYLNKKINRGQKSNPGEYRLIIGVWVMNHSGSILLTLRSPLKKAHPDLWENTSGSVQAGETSIQGALRELREETGIKVDPMDIYLLGSHIETTAIVDQYCTIQDIPICDLRLQAEEVADAKWVSLQEFESMIQENLVAAPISQRYKYVQLDIKKNANEIIGGSVRLS